MLFVRVDPVLIDLPALNLILDQWSHRAIDPSHELDLPDPRPELQRWATASASVDDSSDVDVTALPSPRPELPLVSTPDALATVSQRHWFREVPADRWVRLKADAESLGVDSHYLPLVVLSEVLRAWSRETHFCVAIAGRPHTPGTRGAVGQVSGLELLALTPEQNSTLRERAVRVCSVADQLTFTPQSSLIRILRELRRSDPGASAPVLHRSLPESSPDGFAGFGTLRAIGGVSPQVWIDHQAVPTRGGLVLAWHITQGLFPDGTDDELVDACDALLEELLRPGPDGGVSPAWDRLGPVVRLPSAAEKEQEAANATRLDLPPTLLHLLADQGLRDHPGNVAVIDRRGPITHEALHLSACRYAAAVIGEASPTSGELVAVILSSPGFCRQ